MQAQYQIDVEETWDLIAESFDTTRRESWTQCLDFIDTLKETDIVADVGCGNGRNLIPCTSHCQHVIGVDISLKLLKILQRKLVLKDISNVSLLHSDSVHMPLQDNSMNAVLCIASLHNIKGKDHRRRALHEIFRIMKPGGTALITVWSRWQDKYWRYFMTQYLLRHREYGDIDIYWKQDRLNVPRFYHLYSQREFRKDLKAAHFLVKEVQQVKIRSKYLPDNFFALVQKR